MLPIRATCHHRAPPSIATTTADVSGSARCAADRGGTIAAGSTKIPAGVRSAPKSSAKSASAGDSNRWDEAGLREISSARNEGELSGTECGDWRSTGSEATTSNCKAGRVLRPGRSSGWCGALASGAGWGTLASGVPLAVRGEVTLGATLAVRGEVTLGATLAGRGTLASGSAT
ncbi:MAG TPA: hypothetical protein VI197_16645 [Polyangiaceae bacterium]